MGVRERSQRKRKSPQRKMKISLTILLACVASLKAASLMDVIECPAQCCPATTNVPTTTADPTTGPSTTADPTDDPTTTADPTTTEAPTTTGEPTTTEGPTTTKEPTTTEVPTTTNATADPGRKATEGPTTTGEASTTGAATTTANAATTTENICPTCDQSTCEEGGEGGAASASASILALLLPAVFARLL